MRRTPNMSIFLRVTGATMAAGAAVLLVGAGTASADTTAGPVKTAWYDNSGAQQATGETTPSAAKSGELEVSYAPAGASAPTETVPPAPTVPGAPAQVPSGPVGGSSVGNTLAFAAVDYQVPTTVNGQQVDPTSITAVLTLTLDSTSSPGISTGDLIACPTASDLWSPGGDQDASQAPGYSCGTSAATGNVSGQTVTFDLASAQESPLVPGEFTLAIVPGTSPSGAFQAVITQPTGTSLDVTGESPAANLNQNLAYTPPANPTPAPGAFGIQPFAPTTTFAPTASSPVPSTTPAPLAPTATTPLTAGPVSALRGGLGAGAQRTVALMVLLALGVLLVAASSRTTRAPRSLLHLARTPVSD
ncbi:MAG: hypothetical protein ACYDD4_07920 [Acidimicrobiales bacterium]